MGFIGFSWFSGTESALELRIIDLSCLLPGLGQALFPDIPSSRLCLTYMGLDEVPQRPSLITMP